MRPSVTLLLMLIGLGGAALVWWLSGGRAFVLLLPLVFGLPLLIRRR